MRLAVLASTLLLLPWPALAAVPKTWVSSTGTDSGTCQLAAPCRTLQFAHDQTAAGGEIDVKDTGSYGPLQISKAISVVSGDGVLAAIGVSSGTGITVNAGADDVVLLEGLSIDGHGVGSQGISYGAGKSLTVRNCHVRNVTSNGIAIATSTNVISFVIADTEVSGAEGSGVSVAGYTNAPSGTVSGLFAHDNGAGLSASTASVVITDSTFANNAVGLYAQRASQLFLGRSTIAKNRASGVQMQQGTVYSYGDNVISGNNPDVSGSLQSVARQ